MTKFDLDSTIQKQQKQKRSKPKGVLNSEYKDKYNFYFLVMSIPKLRPLVLPYIHSSILYYLAFLINYIKVLNSGS